MYQEHVTNRVKSRKKSEKIAWSKTFSEKFKKYTADFLLLTSQHGLKYLALPGQTLLEKCLWMTVTMGSIITSIYFIWVSLRDHYEKPSITAIQSIHYPLHKFIFPAVTICSLNKVHKGQATELIKRLKLPSYVNSEQTLEDFRVLTNLMEAEEVKDMSQLRRLQAVLEYNNISIDDVMKNVTPKCDNLLKNCKWKGKQVQTCMNLFRTARTEEGFCCSFNYQMQEDDLEIGSNYKYYADIEGRKAKRTSSCGFLMGLAVLINNEIDEYHATVLASYGIKVLFHNPHEYPDTSSISSIVQPGDHIFYSVSPTIYESSSDIRDIPVARRRCRFSDESHLGSRESYSPENCITECRRQLTVKLCGCSPFYFRDSDNTTSTCKLTDVPCLARNRNVLNTLKLDHSEDDKHFPCGCLPACDKTVFSIERSVSKIIRNYSSSRKAFFASNTDTDSAIEVFYTDTVGVRYQTRRYHDFLDLLASLGGLLSFFLGISVLSLIEIIYFFSIRIIFTRASNNI